MRVAAARFGALEEVKKIPTPKDPKEALEALEILAQGAAGGRAIQNIAGGVPGVLKEGVLLWAANLPEWNGTNIQEKLSRALSCPVRVVHDTALIALAEVHEGAGRGSAICAYVTVSTGVGGDRIVDGKLDRATFGFEIGHQIVGSDTLENQVSGTAVKKKFGIEPKDLGDEAVRGELADIFAIGLYNTTLHWSPDTFVLGGSMIVGVNPIPLSRVEESLKKRLLMYPKAPKVVMAELGDMGGLIGARILAGE